MLTFVVFLVIGFTIMFFLAKNNKRKDLKSWNQQLQHIDSINSQFHNPDPFTGKGMIFESPAKQKVYIVKSVIGNEYYVVIVVDKDGNITHIAK